MGSAGGTAGDAYVRWYRALSEEFFGPPAVRRPVVLYLGLGTEERIRAEHGLTSGLADAVAQTLDWGRPQHLLGYILALNSGWKLLDRSAPPPTLPLLTCSVEAAKQMVSDETMLRSNFHGRWAQELGERPKEGRAKTLEKAYRDTVSPLWRELDEWIKEGRGDRGYSTITTDPHHSHIGYPISQALLRESDRQVLSKFFLISGVGLENAAGLTDRELVRRLQLWTSSNDRGLSARLLKEVRSSDPGSEDPEHSLAGKLLGQLAGQWDGRLHEPERRLTTALRLRLGDDASRLEWTADAVSAVDAEVMRGPEGARCSVTIDYGDVYVGLEELAPTSEQLAHGLTLEGRRLVMAWPGREVVLFRKHEDLGEWVSVDEFEFGNDHLALVSPGKTRPIRAMLTELAGRAPREEQAPLQGWCVFKRIREISADRAAEVLANSEVDTTSIAPPIRDEIELKSGLRIGKVYGRANYLRHGEPDLLLPNFKGGDLKISVDGHETEFASPIPVPLSQLGWEPGPHTVTDGSTCKIFTVSDGLAEQTSEGAGAIGHPVSCSRLAPDATEVSSSVISLRGADVPAGAFSPPRTVLIPRLARSAYLLSPDGGVGDIAIQASAPKWLKRRLPEFAAGHMFEIDLPAGYVWLVVEASSNAWRVQGLTPVVEIPPPKPRPGSERWASVIISAASAASFPAWSEYVTAAIKVGPFGAAG